MHAAFYPSAKSGPGSDADGFALRWQVVLAIGEVDRKIGMLSSDAMKDWPEEYRKFYGTAFAAAVLSEAQTVRAALADLRTNWDRLSVQTVSVKPGLNAFYVYVDDSAPASAVINPRGYVGRIRQELGSLLPGADAAADELIKGVTGPAAVLVETREKLIHAFAGDSVSTALPMSELSVLAGSLESARFSTDNTVEAQAVDPWLGWSETAPDAVNVPSMTSGRICMGVSTAKVTRTCAFLGQGVQSSSMSWHRTGEKTSTDTWNFFGFPLMVSGARADAVFASLDAKRFDVSSRFRIGGSSLTNVTFTAATTATDGGVFVCSASGTSSWYPAPIAWPDAGVVFDAGEDTATFTLRNETHAAQTVSGQVFRAGIMAAALKDVKGVSFRENAFSAWREWNFSGEGVTTNLHFATTLAAGEARTFELRFDREKFDRLARANEYADGFRRGFGGVMRFAFGNGPVCSYLGLYGEPDNGAVTVAWPVGLWAGTLTLDRVSCVKGNHSLVHDVPAAAAMKTRVILHVDDGKAVRLLHHVALQTETVTNASGAASSVTRLYAGSARPSGSGTVVRLDAIAMDIDNPVVAGTGDLEKGVTFAWKVAANGRANPFHHPYHPDHDGLKWDFKTPAPDGDVTDNYRQTGEKPETWSIDNALTLKIDAASADERSGTVSGTCTWTLGNLRRKVNGEDIRAGGTFVLERLQSVGTLETK